MPPAIGHPEPPSNGRGPPQRPTGLARRADPVSVDPGSTERTFALGHVRTMHGPHSGMRRNARADRVRIRLLRARIRRENGHETAFWHGIRHINERLPEKPQVARIGRADTSEALTGPRPSGRPGPCRSWFSGERQTRRNRARRGWRNREERRGKGRHAQSGGAREGLAGSTRMREPRRTRNTQRAARPRRGL